MATTIKCPECGYFFNVYHLEWEKVVCSHCKAEVSNPHSPDPRDLPRYRAFKITYRGPTDFKPARTVILDLWNSKSRILSRDGERDSFAQGVHYLHDLGIPVVAISSTNDAVCDIALSDNFETELK